MRPQSTTFELKRHIVCVLILHKSRVHVKTFLACLHLHLSNYRRCSSQSISCSSIIRGKSNYVISVSKIIQSVKGCEIRYHFTGNATFDNFSSHHHSKSLGFIIGLISCDLCGRIKATAHALKLIQSTAYNMVNIVRTILAY